MDKMVHLRVPPDLLAALKDEAARETAGNVNVLVARILAKHVNLPYTPPKRGGDRLAARLKGVFIRVSAGRAVIVRSDGEGSLIPAKNALALEHFALLAVGRRGGDLSKAKYYPCPPTLAAMAVWE